MGVSALPGPTVTIGTTVGADTNISPMPVQIDFSEEVTGFEADKIAVTNGSASNLTTSDGMSFNAQITPAAEGIVAIGIPAGVAQSVATGQSSEASDQLSINYDTTGPTVSITSTTSELTGASPFPADISFSESVGGFGLADITVTNGTASNLWSQDNASFTVDITPDADGTVTVDVGAGVATDAAGNPNSSAPQLSRTYDSSYSNTDAFMVYANSYDIYDDTGYSADGDNDGVLNPGETARLDIAVRNYGAGDASDIIATLSTLDPYVTIDPATSSYGFGDIPAGYYASVYDS